MKILRTVLIVVAALFIGSLSGWLLRGVYDELFLMEGHVHVVSNARQDHDVSLKLPSGRQLDFPLGAGGSVDFELLDTGEGAISIWLDGQPRDEVGYLTSSNSIIVLTIGDERTGFSQIFPGMTSEATASAER